MLRTTAAMIVIAGAIFSVSACSGDDGSEDSESSGTGGQASSTDSGTDGRGAVGAIDAPADAATSTTAAPATAVPAGPHHPVPCSDWQLSTKLAQPTAAGRVNLVVRNDSDLACALQGTNRAGAVLLQPGQSATVTVPLGDVTPR